MMASLNATPPKLGPTLCQVAISVLSHPNSIAMGSKQGTLACESEEAARSSPSSLSATADAFLF